MSAVSLERFRSECRANALRRATERGVSLCLCEIGAIEAELEKMRPAFERRGRDRYAVVVKRRAGRVVAVYDTWLGCLVSVWPLGRTAMRMSPAPAFDPATPSHAESHSRMELRP